ncbi:MAG: leucine-rich repeat domain-containing protein [Treponema sp.]|nr:leucine-rich repeat domain-containing protein [Treponema sp.]
MKLKQKTIIAIAALALCALVGCFGKKEDKTNALIEAKESGTADVAEVPEETSAYADAETDVLMVAEDYGSEDMLELLEAADAFAQDFHAYLKMEGTVITGCDKAALPANLAIPEGVTEIGAYAFSGCTSLEGVSIPEGVTKIGNDAFYDCKSLESVTLPKSLAEIGSEAFLGCESLKEVKFLGAMWQWNFINTKGFWSFPNIPAKKVACTDGETDLYSLPSSIDESFGF